MEKKKNLVSEIFRDDEIPQLNAIYVINENHNNKYTRLFHSHPMELELYFVHNGSGYYMVDNRLYTVKEGDMIICNAGILHGDAPAFNNNMGSYCCALTNVRIKGLPYNWMVNSKDIPVVSCGSFSNKIAHIMELIYMLSLSRDQLNEVCSSLAVSLLLLMHQLLLSRSRHQVLTPIREIDTIVAQIKEYLDTHYSQNLTLESISTALNMKPSYVSHTFKAEMNISPIQYLLYRRFGEAQSLLMDTELTIAEISDLLGFGNPAHFSAMFKKHVGLSPLHYKQSIDEMNS